MAGLKVSFTEGVDPKQDHTYFNLAVSNLTDTAKAAVFSQNLTNDIVANPAAYYLTVSRLALEGDGIPIFIFEDDAYFISLTYNGSTATQAVVWDNSNLGYGNRFVYSYQRFIQMINKAFSGAFLALSVLEPAIPATAAPYMVWDIGNGSADLYAQVEYASNETTPIKIYMNSVLYNFFANFWIVFHGEGLTSKLDIELYIADLHGTNTSVHNSVIPSGYIRMQQEYSAPYRWYDHAVSIRVKTTRMDLRNEQGGVSLLTNNYGQTQGSLGPPFTSVLTDFIPTFQQGDSAGWRAPLVYNANPYRLIDLLGSEQRVLDIGIFWVDRSGVEHPFLITPGSNASLKLLFVKKGVIAQ
jgi:hypothetical protein